MLLWPLSLSVKYPCTYCTFEEILDRTLCDGWVISPWTKWPPFWQTVFFKCIFLNENDRILTQISLKFVPESPTKNDTCSTFEEILDRTLCALVMVALRWRHNHHAGVSNHQPHGCLFNRLFRRKSKKTSKLRVTGLCAGNSPGTGEFPAQMASYAENVSIWWRHHEILPMSFRAISLTPEAIMRQPRCQASKMCSKELKCLDGWKTVAF